MSKNKQELRFRNIRLLRREELGHGSFGLVCKAQCDQLICAAKVIYRMLRQPVAPDPGREHRQPHRRFESEIDFLKHVHHPNIVQYLGTYEDPDSGDLVLLMELMDESLTRFLESSPGYIPYHTQVNLSYDIAQALAFLHANGIIHRDLSSNNVLLLAGTRAKVTDFGMSKFAERDASMTLSPGTPVFMPPEALKENPVYTEKLDDFSFGVLLVQIVTRKFPNPTNRLQRQEIVTITNRVMHVDVPVPEVERRRGHISLIQQDHPLLPIALDCLKDEGQERPSSQELCGRLTILKKSDSFKASCQQDPANTVREQLQAQSQRYQAEIRQKDEQIYTQTQQQNYYFMQQLETQSQQHQAEIREKDEIIQRLQAGKLRNGVPNRASSLESSDGFDHKATQDGQLESLSLQLADNEQITATLQQELDRRDQEVGELKETLAAQRRESLKLDQEVTELKQSLARKGSVEKTNGGHNGMRWKLLANAPTEITAGSSAVIGNTVYIRPADSRTVHQVDAHSLEWSRLEDHPLEEFTILNVDNTITTVGGVSFSRFGNSSSYSNKLYSYIVGKWVESLPKMPTKRWFSGAAYAKNTLVVAGGFNGEYLSIVEILDTTSRQWYSVNPLPFSTRQPVACVHNDTLYIHPNSEQEPRSVYACFLPELVKSRSKIWRKIFDLPLLQSALTSFNGNLLAVGGCNAKATNHVYQYNENINAWTMASQMNNSRSYCLTAVLPDHRLMVLGGMNPGAEKSVEIAEVQGKN